jgi:putative acetyltransferase
MLVRAEKECDRDAVREINVSAFDTPSEADLVDALRENAHPVVSLVAEENGEIVGHIMFSPVSLSGHPDLQMMGLGPMAVEPAHQKRGIGSALVRTGLEQCRKLNFDAVVVLGHPEYYPRFGFVFMAMELRPEALEEKTGKVRYHPAFGSL